jgi:hypothetical protein
MNAHTEPPAEPQDAPLYLPTDVTTEKLFQAIGRLRRESLDEIDRLIRFLDEIEGHGTEDEESDPAEDGGDDEDDGISEPALGSIEDHPKWTPPIGTSRGEAK